MKRQILAAVAVMFLTAAALAGGTPASFFLDVEVPLNGDEVEVADLPAEGFVVTDVLISGLNTNQPLYLREKNENGTFTRFFLDTISGRQYQFQTGYVFGPNSTLVLSKNEGNSGLDSFRLAIAGYVPCPNQCTTLSVPAVGSLGFGVMLSLAIGAGALVFRRRRQLV